MNLPGNTFGKSVGKAALGGAVIAFPFAHEGGSPASALGVAALSAGVAAVNHIVRSVSNTNDEIKYVKRQEELKAAREERKNRNLNDQQFKDV